MLHNIFNRKRILNKQADWTDAVSLQPRTASGYQQSVEKPRNADIRNVQLYTEAAKICLILWPFLYAFPKLLRFPFHRISFNFSSVA
jgi:hypothetical protein